MNPFVKFATIMVIALELTFIRSVAVNLIVIGVSAVLYLFLHLRWRQWLWLVALPLLPGLGSWFSLMYYSTGDHVHMAWVMLTRVYAYLWLGGLFTLRLANDRDEFLATLEQKIHVSSTFVYALIAVLNFIPAVEQQIKTIRTAALMRGQVLHVWDAQLYFKAVLAAIRWSQHLAEGMVAHGFTEGAPRTHLSKICIPVWQPLVAVVLIVLFNTLLFLKLR
ncbi:MAG TPA: energy-coupling factor transporter transmembrane component T [Lactobacillaceae bacterium]|jgi:energy-coupling factor transport system permease protein